MSDFADCRTIENRDERYKCYDDIEANQAVAGAEDEDSVDAATGNSQRASSVQDSNSENLPVVRIPRQQVEQPAVESNGRDDENKPDGQIDEFGLEKATATRILEGPDGQSELVDTVTGITRISQGLSVITLSSGQRWQQTETRRYYLREGDEVRIYPSNWGESFRLTASRLRGFIQVKRID